MQKRDWSNVDWAQTNEQIAASLGGIAHETVARERARQGRATVRPKRLRLQIADLADALRQIATAIGTPADVDPLADLPGLVMMVQAVVQRAESSAITAKEVARLNRLVDALVAEADDAADAPPPEDARQMAKANAALAKQVKALEAERDRRIDPVEHARAVMKVAHNGMPADSLRMRQAWLDSVVRATLLARVGPDVLAEVER